MITASHRPSVLVMGVHLEHSNDAAVCHADVIVASETDKKNNEDSGHAMQVNFALVGGWAVGEAMIDPPKSYHMYIYNPSLDSEL